MTYSHAVKTETFIRGHMDCIIFSEACSLFHRLGPTTWDSQETRSQVVWQEGSCSTLARSKPKVIRKEILHSDQSLCGRWCLLILKCQCDFNDKETPVGPKEVCNILRRIPWVMLCNYPLPEIYLQAETENLSLEWTYKLGVRKHMPACSCIYSDPLHNLTSFEVLIYLDLARNSLESVLRGKCLKDPQKNLKKFLEHQPLTKHF